jgi:hypothetical protein
LEPFALNDLSHVREEDIIRLRQVLPTLKRVMQLSNAPSDASKAKKKKDWSRERPRQ